MAQIIIYTDGAAKGNPGPGGYGVVLLSGNHRKELSAGFRLTTNNRMELLAVIVALESIKKPEHEVVVYSDSKYVVDSIEKGWLQNWVKKGWKKPNGTVKNVDLWRRILPLLASHRPRFQWVKGHANIPENERCDQLAVKASEKANLPMDQGYEASLKEEGLF